MPPRSGGSGHKRTASKTDFILPPDHDEREKKRSSLQREPQISHKDGGRYEKLRVFVFHKCTPYVFNPEQKFRGLFNLSGLKVEKSVWN